LRFFLGKCDLDGRLVVGGWLVVLVYEYIEGVFERNEDVLKKKVGTKNWSIGMFWLLG